MIKIILTTLILNITLAHAQFGASSSSLNSKCKQDKFNCGECETDLQNDFNNLLNGLTGGKLGKQEHWGDVKTSNPDPGNIPMGGKPNLENTLEEIVKIFKKNNSAGDNKLNFVVIGESESLQGTSVKNGKIYPRVMLKSPNSELMVTFNTDPAAPGYKTLEVMRWNGKKGRYEFQEIHFGDKDEKPHVDVTGAKCIECHKSPSPRPNWDTYRAWAGVIPSRDDMLEMHGENGKFDKSKGMQPDAKAYFNFLEQVAADKDSGKKSRLSMLDIPWDERTQLQEYVGRAAKMSNKEKVAAIQDRVKKEGFYRIKHFPDVEEGRKDRSVSFNFDSKTAELAGPSQFAFDQMLAQNMCKVTVDLKAHPEYNKFKYPLALLLKCNSYDGISRHFPENYKKKILDYYKDTQYSTLADLPKKDKPTSPVKSFDELERLIREDTGHNHNRADQHKYVRHERFMESFLTNVERLPSSVAKEKSKYYSEKVSTPVQWGYHAIDDVGGVKGVPEGHTDLISHVRLLLEPHNVNVSHWSLVHGKDNAYNSFSFSDQFALLAEQPLFAEILKEAGSCKQLEEKAKESFKLAIPEKVLPSNYTDPILASLDSMCAGLDQDTKGTPLDMEAMKGMWGPMVHTLKAPMQQMMKKCAGCHGDDSGITFPGLSNFVKNGDSNEFVQFLMDKSYDYDMSYLELVQHKLGVHGPHGYGSDMPPTKWADNDKYAQENGIDPLNVQNVRRKHLAVYLTMLVGVNQDKESLRKLCNKISQGSQVKEIKAKSKTNNTGATEQ